MSSIIDPWTQPFGRLAPCKSALLPICPSTLVTAMLSVAGTRWKHKSGVIFASIGEICGLMDCRVVSMTGNLQENAG